uniref:Uncharacterized protein n=1 Tax=Anguilla anguilla TaxID=7936 RepID=A0A0E9QXC0_ANGAN
MAVVECQIDIINMIYGKKQPSKPRIPNVFLEKEL